MGIFNLGTGKGSSVLEVIRAFEAACGAETFLDLPDGRVVVRFVTSWATQEHDVEELIAFAQDVYRG